ncbi:hypothetical protein Terro_0601 [Terriglobus roseus DSM 18391]|uniref:Murein endopeptidase K n=2 Tax=Terriglobus roseus TaxID=392734 RepID=I3ZCH3_TERRK|nr:hypothetical protein Terro_0601 [Terriglobus roseus DSM 18391]
MITFSLRRIVCTATLALGIMSLSGASRAEESVPTVPSVSMTAPKTGILAGIRLKLHHLHTGESIDVAYKEGGQYSDQGVNMLNRFLRDHRTQDTADYDPREFDLLHALLVKLGKPNATIDIVCGYRTPLSNNFLRTRSADTGVAEHSQHMLSKAIDIRIPGVSTLKLRNAALALGMGGVGYYPTSQFVHVDVGPVRQWQFGGRPANQMASRGRRHGHKRSV